jgi:hypothetical protein
MDRYFKFKNLFLPYGLNTNYVIQHLISSNISSHNPTDNLLSHEYSKSDSGYDSDSDSNSNSDSDSDSDLSNSKLNLNNNQDNNTTKKPYLNTEIVNNNSNIKDVSSSDSDSELFKYLDTIYQLVGIVKERNIWIDPIWWVIDINNPEEIKKINKPSLISISGIFKHNNMDSIPIGSKVKVEITFNSNKSCIWEKNKIISLL